MAGSRLPNFGTIFSRTTGLFETGAIKELPIWYNVYKKYPPMYEPNRNRQPASQDPIPEIVYEEDFQRAQKSNLIHRQLESIIPDQGPNAKTKLSQ